MVAYDLLLLAITLVISLAVWLYAAEHGRAFRYAAVAILLAGVGGIFGGRFLPTVPTRLVLAAVVVYAGISGADKLTRSPRKTWKVALAVVGIVLFAGIAASFPWQPFSKTFWIGDTAGGPFVIAAVAGSIVVLFRLIQRKPS